MENTALILRHRLEQVQEILKEQELAGVLVCNGIRENLDSWLLAARGIPVLQPFGRMNLFYVSEAGEVTPLCAFENHPCDFPHYPLFDPSVLGQAGAGKRLGVVNPACMLEVTWQQIRQAWPDLELVDLTGQFALAKARKSREELQELEAAAGAYDKLFAAMPWLLRPGHTEYQTVVELRHRAGQLGAAVAMLSEDPMATTLVKLTSAPQGAQAEEEAQLWPGRRLCAGDRVNVCVNGYLDNGFSGALGRAYVLGKADEETEKYWALAVEAQDFLAKKLLPGATIQGAVKQLNQLLGEKGIAPVGANCVFSIGCSRSEAPRNVDASGALPLEVGMTLVIAPELRIPGQDSYRCMDPYLVTEQGCRRLSRLSRNLMELN